MSPRSLLILRPAPTYLHLPPPNPSPNFYPFSAPNPTPKRSSTSFNPPPTSRASILTVLSTRSSSRSSISSAARTLSSAFSSTRNPTPPPPKSEGFFIRIMSLYTKASMPDHAFRTFEQIPVRTEKSLCALLAAYLEQRRFDRVRELFYSVPAELGIVPGVASHNVILAALCEAGDVDAACKLLDEMLMKKNLEPGIIAYNSILNGYLKKDDKAGFVDTLKTIYSKGITPNLFTYNIRMLDFCKKSESFKAEELLDVVISKGMQPNFSAFNTVITGFCEELDFESAIRVFKKMKSMKNANGKALFSPNADTFLALIRGLVDNGDFVMAQKICRDCLRMKYAPPFETMKALINGLVKDSKVVDAKYLAVMMRKVAKGDALDSWTKLEAELPL
ncbi:hypothetical protein KSP39_PZI012980 [Platanthera zijinensis]|uniref:Pentatricopeptide repeat-containing protein n=1 Tax=Platanthera zijinensis TaxID=2320716 RepID=A0AAP0BCC1_9ASPA